MEMYDQVDYGEAAIRLKDATVDVKFFCIRLCHSGAFFVTAFLREIVTFHYKHIMPFTPITVISQVVMKRDWLKIWSVLYDVMILFPCTESTHWNN